jgi:DUF1365 family protein
VNSGLYAGEVMHQRLRPRRHRLAYRLFMLLLDLDELDALDGRSRLFSRNRRNLVSFLDRDHGDGSDVPLKAQVERDLADAGFPTGGPIQLLTMPRLFGFVFNPISVYFCHDRAGCLTATLYEVTNTFGQRHRYLLPAHGGGVIRQHIAKNLYVSPFLGMDMTYDFRLRPPGDEAMLAITASDERGAMLVAAMKLRRRALTDAALLKAVAAHPLMTFKVVAGIHWEALLLWLKRVPLVRRPPPPREAVSGPRHRAMEEAA